MTHWEYPEAIERFGRILNALGIADELVARGAMDNDLVMVDEFDFDFAPRMTNPYIPAELLERDEMMEQKKESNDYEEQTTPWIPYAQGGFLEDDMEELLGFEEDDWDAFDEDDEDFQLHEDDEVWQA